MAARLFVMALPVLPLTLHAIGGGRWLSAAVILAGLLVSGLAGTLRRSSIGSPQRMVLVVCRRHAPVCMVCLALVWAGWELAFLLPPMRFIRDHSISISVLSALISILSLKVNYETPELQRTRQLLRETIERGESFLKGDPMSEKGSAVMKRCGETVLRALYWGPFVLIGAGIAGASIFHAVVFFSTCIFFFPFIIGALASEPLSYLRVRGACALLSPADGACKHHVLQSTS